MTHGRVGIHKYNNKKLTGVLVKVAPDNTWHIIDVAGTAHSVTAYFGCSVEYLTFEGAEIDKSVRSILSELATIQQKINNDFSVINEAKQRIMENKEVIFKLTDTLKYENPFKKHIHPVCRVVGEYFKYDNNFATVEAQVIDDGIMICITEHIYIQKVDNPLALPFVTMINRNYQVIDNEITENIACQYKDKSKLHKIIHTGNYDGVGIFNTSQHLNVTNDGCMYYVYRSSFFCRSEEKLVNFIKLFQ